ncbi:helix-turn-helix domain-containing protein [Algicella marina]|uniref:Helix-turn-helix domain-containing protein n=1 Tax=Algicella marina TaxID=2683284 RepID=A0A6P1T156_9RHOB|nr:helix-turn-helix domain-containing protein [Algicella marina]QHQ35019.1 helix-turn-helix domain-containing protein [Algicella marina]
MEAFGDVLRQGRKAQRMSQMALALEVGVSARHLSFIESGRSRPSRGLVLRLADVLRLAPAARNRALEAVGFAPVHRARSLTEPELAPVLTAMQRMLRRHDPYPGVALDAEWRLLAMNGAARRVFAGLEVGASVLDVLVTQGAGAALFENWEEMAGHLAARLRTESAAAGGLETLEVAARLLDTQAAPRRGPLPPFLHSVMQLGDARLTLLSTIAQFGGAEDLTVADLRIELFHPADEASAVVLEWMAANPA